MSNRRVKAVSYDDDDGGFDSSYESYEDEGYEEGGQDELTEDDKYQLQEGTAKVRSLLGDQDSFTDKEIQDALWHYYYDVDKSLAYLKNSKKPKQAKQKPKAAVSTNDPQILHLPGTGDKMLQPLLQTYPQVTNEMDDFFHDVPWGQVPAARIGVMRPISTYPKGGLLGGSSKLAALAAARKKKEAERLAAEASSNDRSIDLLDRLGKDKSAASEVPSQARTMTFPSRQKKQKTEESEPPPEPEKVPEVAVVQREDLRANPSIFAKTLFGSNEAPNQGGVSLTTGDNDVEKQDANSTTFRLPYMDDPEYVKRDPFVKPSPDDIVLQAQGTNTPTKQAASKTAHLQPKSVTDDLASLKLQDAPKPRSKNLNVLEEFQRSNLKNAASFVVVGHVDHGKSTLMGRLLYDLGVVDEKQLERLRRDSKKIGKASFALAWVMDATSDERERGVTVDIATNYFETDKTRFTILDAPGHKDFVPNMISGASQADFAVLVIDASTNSFESGLRGQTKEHALLVRSMGVKRLIVAVNKMDMCAWSQERFEEIKTQMTAFLTTANFSPKTLSFVPCSGLEGQNISKPFESPESSWYTGPTLVAELENAEPARRVLEKPLRLTITEVFKSGVNNPVSISGKLDSGTLQVGDVLKIQPSGETAYIKSVEADGVPSDWAVAGQIAVLNLTDIDPIHIRVGDIASHPKSPVMNVKSITAKVLTFDHLMPMYIDVHKGALHQAGRIESLIAVLDKTSGEVIRKKPKVLQPQQVARVVIALESELPLEAGSKIILRSEGNTVAAGMVE